MKSKIKLYLTNDIHTVTIEIKEKKNEEYFLFLCPKCEWSTRSTKDWIRCEKCSELMNKLAPLRKR